MKGPLRRRHLSRDLQEQWCKVLVRVFWLEGIAKPKAMKCDNAWGDRLKRQGIQHGWGEVGE